MDGPCAVVAAVLVHDKRFPRVGAGSPAGEGDHRTHYWALRQQARCCFPAGEQGWLSPRLWWWGVVFDLWIVVASIERSGMVSRSLMCNFSKLVCIFIVVSV